MTLRQALPAIRTLAREMALAPMAGSCTCGHINMAHAVGGGPCHGRTARRLCTCQRFVGWYPHRARDFERFGVTLVKRLQTLGGQRVPRKVKKGKKSS